jgi:hypothetical protein
MFIVEGRTLGVLAALCIVLSMAVVFDRLSATADSTEPPSPTASAPVQALRHDESAPSDPSVAATRPRE